MHLALNIFVLRLVLCLIQAKTTGNARGHIGLFVVSALTGFDQTKSACWISVDQWPPLRWSHYGALNSQSWL